ncbi:MAG: chromate efflux transporter [Anaerolineales bacterium]
MAQVLRLFVKLGVTGFGGPAATVAMMEDEVVNRRRWLTRTQFLDVVGVTNLIPGPNATEIAMHVGLVRAGWLGLITAGVSFIVPAAAITLGLAWLYARYGALPAIAPLLAGIKPAVLAVIATALWRLGKTGIKNGKLAVMGLVVLAASLWGVNEILALFAGGVLGMVWLQADSLRRPRSRPGAGAMGLLVPGLPLVARPLVGVAAPTVLQLGLFFLKIGAVMYGSGYVLIAFLQGGLVDDLGWLTQQQLLDAIAAGQFTPGPLLSTATFIGYLLLGLPGAGVATVAVFLPSFVFSAILGPIVPRFRRSPWAAAFLDAVNACSLGLMAAVALELGASTLRSWPAVLILVLSAIAGLRWKLNSAWLVLGGAAIGGIAALLGWG